MVELREGCLRSLNLSNAKPGNPTGGDMRRSKTTRPVLFAFQNITESLPGRLCGSTNILNQIYTDRGIVVRGLVSGLSSATWTLRCCRGWIEETPP